MRKLNNLVMFLAAFGVCQSNVCFSAEAQRIGVVDMRTIISSSPQVKAVMEKLKQEFKAREEQILAAEKSMKDKTEKLQRNAAVMSEPEKSKLEKEIVTAQRDLQRMQTEYRDDATVRQQEEMKKLIEKINKIVQDVAQKEQYDMILHAEAASFASNKINVTDKVLSAVKSSSGSV